MRFNDDEPIDENADLADPGGGPIKEGNIQIATFYNTKAPLKESELKVLLELLGVGSSEVRSGVDLVTVLDISGSMSGEKLDKLKLAMQFIIKKLSPLDRLSVVTFAGQSRRLCPLRQITKTSQPEIESLVNSLVAGGTTNMSAGLQTGLKVLNDRRYNSSDRVIAIMLMSDGEQNAGSDAAQVDVSNVPVYTFGYGADQDSEVLKAIADNSSGGTYSDVYNQDNLSIAFSQCLAGLLTVVVQDLKLTVKALTESKIKEVSAGNYQQSRDDDAVSVTVSFGDLYNKELRKVIVNLVLPAVDCRTPEFEVLEITYSYKSTRGKLFDAAPITLKITRDGTSVEPDRKEVKIEETRLQIARMMKEARHMADVNKLADAQKKLVDAQNKLEDAVDDESNYPLIQMLKSELRQLLRLMQSKEIYEMRGRHFALSSETSHDRQRFAARGDDAGELRLFATPRMDTHLKQARSHAEDPSQPLPTVDEDLGKELADNPLAPKIGAIRIGHSVSRIH